MTLKQERNRELYAAYLRVMRREPNHLSMTRHAFFSKVVESGAPRFFISVRKAAAVIHVIELGGIPRMSRQGRRMSADLYDAYLRKREQMPGCYKHTVIQAAVMQPAPSFYLTPERAMDIILSEEACL